MTTKTFEEKAESEEWGAWKYVSEMLDNPDEYGIYPTGKCYEQIHDFVVEQKQKAATLAVEKERERIRKQVDEMSWETTMEELKGEMNGVHHMVRVKNVNAKLLRRKQDILSALSPHSDT